ncbi:MAG: DUF2493 domain-containing protein [Bacteroidales bacterium]|nr:DUF2493 domain-containing protein [Bacteroidales bacterium]
MKIGIVGSRNPGVNYQDWEALLLAKIDLSNVDLVVSGGAKGVDYYAKVLAARHHIPYMEFAPKYSVYGKYATLKRNTQIVTESSTVVAFPTPDSRGTHHSIREAKRLKRNLIVISIPSGM